MGLTKTRDGQYVRLDKVDALEITGTIEPRRIGDQDRPKLVNWRMLIEGVWLIGSSDNSVADLLEAIDDADDQATALGGLENYEDGYRKGYTDGSREGSERVPAPTFADPGATVRAPSPSPHPYVTQQGGAEPWACDVCGRAEGAPEHTKEAETVDLVAALRKSVEAAKASRAAGLR